MTRRFVGAALFLVPVGALDIGGCGGDDCVEGESTAERDAKLWTDILDPFPVTLNDDNYAGLPGGAYPAALYAGHHALLLPLPPGDHTLEFGGAQCDGGEVVFEVSAVYNLHVGN